MKTTTKTKMVALTAAMVLPLSGIAEAEVYGRFQLALENIDVEATPAEPDNTDAWKVESYASRFGVKGKVDTDFESVKAVYKMEWGVDVTDEKDTADNHIQARDQYAGIAGNFGEIILGRINTPFKQAQGKLDLFNDYKGDIKVLMKHGETRADNIFQYTSPKIADTVTIAVLGIPGEEDTVDVNGNAENGIADATSISVSYDDDMLHVAVARDSGVAGTDVDATRLAATAKLGDFGIGVLHQSTGYATGDEEVLIASAYYKTGRTKFKLQAGKTGDYSGIAGNDAELTAFGVDYSLSKSTTIGAYLFAREGGDGLAANQSEDTLGFSFIHKF